MRTNPDTSLGTEFWRTQPHLFVPAGWGRKYCRCCLDPKRRKIHDVKTDPATHVGNCTDYRVAWAGETCFAVTGWNDPATDDGGDGGGCHYQVQGTYEEALAFAQKLAEVGEMGGDRDGRKWDHLQIAERTYFTAVDTNVVVLS